MPNYTVVAIWNPKGYYKYHVKVNDVFETSCDTLWGAKLEIKRRIKGSAKKPKKEKELRDKYPDFPVVYRVIA
jgi:hypothetical protein